MQNYIGNGLRFLGKAAVATGAVAALTLAAPAFGQTKYEDCAYRTPDKKAWCTKMSTLIGCHDSSDDFYVGSDAGKVKFFRYGQLRTDVIDPNYECVSGNCVYRGSKEEVAARKRRDALIKHVMKPENCTQDAPRRKMLGIK